LNARFAVNGSQNGSMELRGGESVMDMRYSEAGSERAGPSFVFSFDKKQ
jgi:hypothetical protein